MDEFGTPNSLTNPRLSNVSKSVCKEIPLFLWSKN